MGYQRRVHGDSSLESQVELTERHQFGFRVDYRSRPYGHG